jgi:hypothetical protein
MQPFINHLKILFLGFTLTWSGCKSPKDSVSSDLDGVQVLGGQLGQFKGIQAVSRIISSRLMIDEKFSLLGGVSTNLMFGQMENLLGGFEGEGVKNKFTNGTPNALNMLLWRSIIKNFATDLASSTCYQKYLLNEQAIKALGVCRVGSPKVGWPGESSRIWDVVMQQDAPKSEYQAWELWIKSSDFNKSYKNPEEKMVAALSGIFLNPYFLLEN